LLNRASGQDFGLILSGNTSKSVLRKGKGRPENRFEVLLVCRTESSQNQARKADFGQETLLSNLDYT
jgi:hypothetical protein